MVEPTKPGTTSRSNAKFGLLGATLFVLGGIVGLILSNLFAKQVATSATVAPPEDYARETSLTRVLGRLDEIRDSIAPSVAIPPSTEPARRPVAAEWSLNEEQLKDFSAKLSELQEIISSSAAILSEARESIIQSHKQAVYPELDLLQRYPSSPNWDALQDLLDDYRGGGATGAAVQRLLGTLKWTSQEQLLQTYGRPSSIGTDGTWTYSREPAIQGLPNNVQFSFISSYVMGLRIF